tara:strand:+ start:117 stop:1166 length:1050 start_codon:yes stop_codon:yes gene_type:complete
MLSDQEKEEKLMKNKIYTAKYLKMIIKEKASLFKGYSTMKKNELIDIILSNRIHFKVLHQALEKEPLNSENIKKPLKKLVTTTVKTTKKPTTKPPNKSKAITTLKNNIKELKKELKKTKDEKEKEAIKLQISDEMGDLKELLKEPKQEPTKTIKQTIKKVEKTKVKKTVNELNANDNAKIELQVLIRDDTYSINPSKPSISNDELKKYIYNYYNKDNSIEKLQTKLNIYIDTFDNMKRTAIKKYKFENKKELEVFGKYISTAPPIVKIYKLYENFLESDPEEIKKQALQYKADLIEQKKQRTLYEEFRWMTDINKQKAFLKKNSSMMSKDNKQLLVNQIKETEKSKKKN